MAGQHSCSIRTGQAVHIPAVRIKHIVLVSVKIVVSYNSTCVSWRGRSHSQVAILGYHGEAHKFEPRSLFFYLSLNSVPACLRGSMLTRTAVYWPAQQFSWWRFLSPPRLRQRSQGCWFFSGLDYGMVFAWLGSYQSSWLIFSISPFSCFISESCCWLFFWASVLLSCFHVRRLHFVFNFRDSLFHVYDLLCHEGETVRLWSYINGGLARGYDPVVTSWLNIHGATHAE